MLGRKSYKASSCSVSSRARRTFPVRQAGWEELAADLDEIVREVSESNLGSDISYGAPKLGAHANYGIRPLLSQQYSPTLSALEDAKDPFIARTGKHIRHPTEVIIRKESHFPRRPGYGKVQQRQRPPPPDPLIRGVYGDLWKAGH